LITPDLPNKHQAAGFPADTKEEIMTTTEIIPVTELTNAELDAVSGAVLNFFNSITQLNVAVPIASAQGGSGANSAAAILQAVGQANVSI
jgi:hypothetical protein